MNDLMPDMERLLDELVDAAVFDDSPRVSAARAALLAEFARLREREKALRDVLTKRQGRYLYTVRDLIARHAAGEGEYLHHWAKLVLPAIDAALASGEQP